MRLTGLLSSVALLVTCLLPLSSSAQRRQNLTPEEREKLIEKRNAIEQELESVAIIDRKVMVPMRDGKRMAAEELVRLNYAQSASGKWHRFGEAAVEFSPSFLMLSDQKPGFGGGIYGRFEKTLTLFPSLVLGPEDAPRLHRRLSW
jgi:hypothetical protein